MNLERIEEARRLMDAVYKTSFTGGNLHIVVDDGNVDDGCLDFCEKAIEENYHKRSTEDQELERRCLSSIRNLTLEEREYSVN